MGSKLSFCIEDPAQYPPTLDLLQSCGLYAAKWQFWDSETALGMVGAPLNLWRPRLTGNVTNMGEVVDAVTRVADKLRPYNIVIEGPWNEPPCNEAVQVDRLNADLVVFANAMHTLGFRCAGPAFSTGNPIPANLGLLARLKDGLAALDYWTLHNYSISGTYWRQIWDALPLHDKHLIITETGWDIAGDAAKDGWTKHLTPQAYMDLLAQLDAEMQTDPYILAGMIYMVGPSWPSFNVCQQGMLERIVGYIRERGGGTVPQPLEVVEVLSDMELAQLVTAQNFPQPDVAIAIILAESGGKPKARNSVGNTPADSVDRGLWQINSHWHAEVKDECAFDPVCSTREAYRISKQGTDFTPWSAFKQGTYKPFLARGQAALAATQPIYKLTADKRNIQLGESVTLTWHVENVKAAYLNGVGITGPRGSKVVTPQATITYDLQANLPNGDIRTSHVVITVGMATTERDAKIRELLEQALALLK